MMTRLPILTLGLTLFSALPAPLSAQTPPPAAPPPATTTPPILPTSTTPENPATATPPNQAGTQPDAPTTPRQVPLLKVGDSAAPGAFEKVLLGEWTQLKPTFGDGKIYVLDFWATWCPVCRRGFPHLTELATSLGDKAPTIIAINGVDARGDTLEKTTRALAKMRPLGALPADEADKQPINFVFDDAATTRQAFLRPARIAAIPAAFVIDGAGKIAWIGNPVTQREDLEATVKAVVAGTFDIAAARERFDKQLAERARIDEQAVALQVDLRQATEKAELDRVMITIDALIALDKDRFGRLVTSRLSAMLTSDIAASPTPAASPASAATLAYARKIITTIMPDDAATLEGVSWALLDVDDPAALPAERIAIAFDAAQLAVKATLEEDARALDALARAHFAKGDFTAAEKTQSRAAILAAGEPTFDAIRERLLQYREAADSRKKSR